jgi:hypothetical protein
MAISPVQLVLTDVLPPLFQGRMDCGATYWGRRTTFSKIKKKK